LIKRYYTIESNKTNSNSISTNKMDPCPEIPLTPDKAGNELAIFALG